MSANKETTDKESKVISLTFFKNWHDISKEQKLTDDQYGKLVYAMCEYCFYGKDTTLEGTIELIFKMAKPSINHSSQNKINGSKGGENARGKSGAPRGNKNARKNKTDDHEADSQNGDVPCGSDEPSDKEISSKHKPKEIPLREREPVNDTERVEKVYLQNWDTLYSQNKVKTPYPVINWNQTRSLLKTHFINLKPEIIIQAINNGMKDDFIMSGGYSLGTMLAASVLNRLINLGSAVPTRLADKKSLSGLGSTFKHHIASDNIPPEEAKKYFREE